MRELLQQGVEFYSMIEYFTTRNEDDTIGVPSIPSKPFDGNEKPNKQFIDIVNNKFLNDTNISCTLLTKRV